MTSHGGAKPWHVGSAETNFPELQQQRTSSPKLSTTPRRQRRQVPAIISNQQSAINSSAVHVDSSDMHLRAGLAPS
jgi:hypothetical protein